jgi:hypothetical protein
MSTMRGDGDADRKPEAAIVIDPALVDAITACIGGPYLMWLLRRRV